MYKTLYIEQEVRDSQLTHSITRKFPASEIIYCDRYTEIFNRKSQDFRIQKQEPSLILAKKHQGFVHPTPPGYGVGGTHNYYFSIMLNCVFDCRYCFLQGMYRSANHVLFVNFDEFEREIHKTALQFTESDQVWFFSGYDCDSLALEPIAGFADFFMNAVENHKNVWLELRTKSTQIRSMLEREAVDHVVTAFSITPNRSSKELENGVPSISKRITAMQKLQQANWKIGLRFDPLIWTPDFKEQYSELFKEVFSSLDLNLLHSVSVGVFRLPATFYKTLRRIYPEDKFIAQPFHHVGSMISYPIHIESSMKNWCLDEISKYVDQNRIYYASFDFDK